MTDEKGRRGALLAAACDYGMEETVSPDALLEAARAWVKAEEAEKRSPPIIHFQTEHGWACGHLNRTGKGSTYHAHVTCQGCRKTVAYYRAGGKRA